MKLKTVMTTLAVVALTLSLAMVAEARPGRGKGRGGGIEKILHRADLTDDQKAQLEALREEHRAEMKPLRQDMRAKRRQMHQLWAANAIDEAAVWTLDGEMTPLRQEIHRMRLEHRLEVMAILTPEQRAALHDAKQKKSKQRKRKNR